MDFEIELMDRIFEKVPKDKLYYWIDLSKLLINLV